MTLADLERAMDAAAAARDFEEASRLRDRISLLRGAAGPVDADTLETGGLVRQQPGSMGLGTSRQRPTPPAGWVKPPKPDSMTKGRRRPAP